MNSKRPIRVPADARGLKFRIPSGGVLVDTLQAIGAGSATIPFSDTYPALQQRVVDGTVASFDNIQNEKYAEVLKYLTVSNLNSLSYVVLTNKTFWEGLPEELQVVVKRAMAEATDLERALSVKQDRESMEALKTRIQVHELTPEERQTFDDAVRPVWAKYEATFGKVLFDAALRANQPVLARSSPR